MVGVGKTLDTLTWRNTYIPFQTDDIIHTKDKIVSKPIIFKQNHKINSTFKTQVVFTASYIKVLIRYLLCSRVSVQCKWFLNMLATWCRLHCLLRGGTCN